MNHSEIGELLSAYANGEVSQTQREFVEEHLVTHASCQAELAEFRTVRGQLTALREFPAAQQTGEFTMTAIRSGRLQQRTGGRFFRPALAAGMAAVAIAVLSTLLLTGGDEGDNTLARAQESFAKLDSYRMSGTTVGVADGETYVSDFDWSYFQGGDAHGVFTGPDGVVEFVLYDGAQYSRVLSGAGGFILVDDGPLSPVPSRDGTLNFLDSLVSLTELEDGEIDSVATERYTGAIDLVRVFEELIAEFGLEPGSEEYEQAMVILEIQRLSEIMVELWISKSDGLLQRLVIDARLVSATSNGGVAEPGPESTFRTVADYSEFNEQAEIEAPVTSSGEPKAGWRLLPALQPDASLDASVEAPTGR